MMGRCSGARAAAAEDEDDDLVKVEKHSMIVRSQMAVGDGVTGQEIDNGDRDDDDDEEYEDAMDVDDFTVSHSDSASYSEDEDAHIAPIKKKINAIKRKKINYDADDLDSQIETAMKFGQKLQQDYQDDTREEIKSALEVGYPRCLKFKLLQHDYLIHRALLYRKLSHCWHILTQRTVSLVICYTHRGGNL